MICHYHYLFLCSHFSSLGQLEPPQAGLFVLLTSPHHSLNNLMLLVQDIPGSSCTFPALAIEITISAGSPNYFNGKWNLESNIWYLYILIISRFFSLDTVWEVYMCMCTPLCVCILPMCVYQVLIAQNVGFFPTHMNAFLNIFRLWHPLQETLL